VDKRKGLKREISISTGTVDDCRWVHGEDPTMYIFSDIGDAE
jgi:hypothetical protein